MTNMHSSHSLHSLPASRAALRSRAGMTLTEVIVALGILGGVLLGLGIFSVNLSQSVSTSKVRIAAAQLASDRLVAVKGAPRYSAIESLYVATEASVANNPGYRRQTWVSRVGGAVTDTIDYKIVTVQVSHSQLAGNIRKTTTIAPF